MIFYGAKTQSIIVLKVNDVSFDNPNHTSLKHDDNVPNTFKDVLNKQVTESIIIKRQLCTLCL